MRRRVAQEAAEQVQRERVAFHVFDQLLELRCLPDAASFTPSGLEQLHAGGAWRGAAASSSGAVVCQKACRSGSEYRVVTTHRPWLVAASPLSSAAMPWSLSSPGVGEVGAYCSGSRPSRMRRLRRSPTRRASRWPFSNAPARCPPSVRVVAEEGEGFLEEQVGRSGQSARACPGCRRTTRRRRRSPASPDAPGPRPTSPRARSSPRRRGRRR